MRLLLGYGRRLLEYPMRVTPKPYEAMYPRRFCSSRVSGVRGIVRLGQCKRRSPTLAVVDRCKTAPRMDVSPRTSRGRIAVAALAVACLSLGLAPPAGAHHRRRHHLVTWGSSLQPPPTTTINGDYAADAEFWPTKIGSSAPGVRATVRAPVTGQIVSVRLRVGDDSRAVPIRFSVVDRVPGGRFRVVTTSTPAFTLPAHSPGIHTFLMKTLMFPMPIRRGSYLAVATPGVKPAAMLWYATVGAATTDSYTSHGPTQNPGYLWSGSRHAGLELLMQVTERPGPYRG